MKEILNGGVKLFGRLIIINIMCFFMVISINAIGTAIFTDNIGYIAYGTTEENDESQELYRYYFEDGEDNKQSQYEQQGYTITKVSILSNPSSAATMGLLLVIQCICLILLVCFIHPKLWQSGSKDSNLVKYNHKTEDVLKGFKMGLVAIVPSSLLLIVLVLTKNSISANFSMVLYKFLNSSFYSFIDFGTKTANVFKDLNVAQIILLFALPLIVPISSGISYLLGYKNISLGEKIVYEKK